MRTFSLYTTDVILFAEKVRTDRPSFRVSESLTFTETLKHNRHYLSIVESMTIRDLLTSSTTRQIPNIIESLVFSEHTLPRSFQCDVFDILQLVEHKSSLNFVEQLHFRETLTLDKRKAKYDTLVFTETIGLKVKRVLIINETLNLTEGLTFTQIRCGDRPCLVGPATNTLTVTLSTFDNRYSVTVMSPDFDNTEALQFTRVNKKTRGGDLIIFRDPQWPKSTTLTYTWKYLGMKDRDNLMTFVSNTVGQVFNLLDYEGNNHSVYIKNPDTDFSRKQKQFSSVRLDFETQS